MQTCMVVTMQCGRVAYGWSIWMLLNLHICSGYVQRAKLNVVADELRNMYACVRCCKAQMQDDMCRIVQGQYVHGLFCDCADDHCSWRQASRIRTHPDRSILYSSNFFASLPFLFLVYAALNRFICMSPSDNWQGQTTHTCCIIICVLVRNSLPFEPAQKPRLTLFLLFLVQV